MKNLSCPFGPDWDALVAKVGLIEANRDYLEYNGQIRDPEVVASKVEARKEFKRNLEYYQGDEALMEQEEKEEDIQFEESLVKPGVEELFNSNPELANQVYEALGFKTKPDVILPIGTSGSGKSTFIKSLPQKDLVVIEPDAMRVEFTGDINNKSKDKEIYEEAAKRAVKAIKQGKQVVFDTTNLTKDKRLPFIEAIKKALPNANIQYKLMELNPELAKQRIKAQIARGENRANVSDATIDRHAESYKQMLKDIKSEPISNFEITPQQKQQALQLYSQYLDSIFPNSQVKDIVYHGAALKFDKFNKSNLPDSGIYFDKNKATAYGYGDVLIPAILNSSGYYYGGNLNRVNSKQIRENGETGLTNGSGNIVFEPEQIHILGNKKDIEGFKEFTTQEKETQIIEDRKLRPVKVKEPTLINKLKKTVGLSRKEINGSRKGAINAAVVRFNKVNNTNYYVNWNQLGQSNTFTYTITGGLKPGKQTKIDFYRYDNITAPENLLENSSYSYEVLSKVPMEYNQVTNEKELGKRMVSTISKRLSENLGIMYENVTPEQAAELTEKADIQWNGEPAFFIGDTVYFVGENLSEATQLHEFGHPLVRAILISNPELFNRLYNNLANSEEGKQVVAEVAQKYREYDKSSNRFKEEAIVRSLEKAAILQRQNTLASSGFSKFIQDFLYQIKKVFRQLFGKVKVSDLDVNTSIDQLADMLQNDFFDIKQDIVSLKDEIAFQRITDDFRNELNEIIEKDPAGLQSIADEMYKLSSNYLYKLEKEGNYKALEDILKDQFSSNDLIEMKSSISNYQRVLIKKARQVREDVDFRRNQSAAIVQNIQRVFQIATKLNSYMAEVAKEPATPDSVNKMHYYSTMLNDIKEFADMVATVLDQNDLGTSKLGDYVNAIKGRVDASQKYSSKIYAEGVTNVLYSFIEDTNKALEQRKKEKIEDLKNKNANINLIRDKEKEFDDLIVDKDKFIAILNGNLGDQGALSAFFESYAGNPDPVIASFGLFIKKHIYDVLYKTRDRIYDLHKELVPALEKAGYKGTNPEEFFKDLVYLEKTFSVENGEEKINQFDYALLAPVKGSDYFYANQSFLKKKLKQQAIDSGDYTEYAKFLKEEALYKRKYFNQDYSDEYYDLDKIYDADYNYTDESGNKQTINGWEAYALVETINQELKLIEDDPMEDLDILQKSKDKEVVLRKRAQLFNLKYDNGKPKVGKDLVIAEILNKYKEAAKPFVEYNPRPDAFQKYLSRYEEMLRARGVSDDQFTVLREKFILANTEIAYEDIYYQDLAEVAEEIDIIMSTIPSIKNRDKIKEALSEISSALLGYRDENGQPVATDMSDERIKRVKDAEILMEKLNNELGGVSGLTPEEWEEFRSFWDIIESKKKLTADQQKRFDALSEQKEDGATEIQKKQLAKAYAKFNSIRSKEATNYYIDKFNYFLSKIDTDVLNEEFGIREVDKEYIDLVLGYKKKTDKNAIFSTSKLYSLLNQDEEFKTWFEENHYKKTYFDAKTKKDVIFYKRVGVWSVNRPTQDKYYKKTEIKDAEGNVIETINRVPAFKFRERKIKEKVEIKDAYGRVIKTINNFTPKIVGKTVDNRNRWLPKSIEQGAPQDSPFINNEYYALKNNNPDKFKALEILKEYHLATQEGLDNQSKNYLYIPRYGKEFSEKLQTKGALKEKRNKLTSLFSAIKEAFVARPDDYDRGLNYKPENQYMAIASDIFNDDESSIAITGLSNMAYSDVSLDLPQVIMKFGLAAEKQKKLTEIWPISNALSQLLSDPKASLTIEKMVNSQYVNRQIAVKPTKKGNSQRAQSAKNLIDREFKGINLKGLGSDQPWLIKGVSNLMKTASFGFFGLDFQSATTNTLGMYFQSVIESVGGNNLNPTNLAAGTYWANTTLMRQLTMSIYKKGQNKPVELQMWEIFDPAQGRLEEKMPEELSRTLGRDVMNLSFIYSPRKFGELSNIASMWAGMMKQKKIEQKVGNTTKEIEYIDAWELGPDGKIKLKDGIDKSYDIGGNQFRLFQNMVHEKMRKLGSVANYDSPEANRILTFRLISFLRRHLIPMIIHRMGFAGKPWAPKETVNYASGEAQMGTYIRTLKELLSAFKYGGDNIKYMDKQDAAAFYRALTEVGGLIACSLALYWIFGYDPDDEDRYKKLRKKSGPLPTPWTDEEEMRRYPFNLQGWLANHAVYQLIKVRAENESFLPLPGFGLDDYSKLIEFDAGAVFSPTIGNTTKVLTGLWDLSMDNPSAYYKRDVGAYAFQQAEGIKALNYLAKMLGMTGKTTDPVMAIKNFTSIQAKSSGSTSGRTKKQEDRETDTYLIR